ncbi:mucin-2-like isoform X2 [Acanthaster planci]|uniref:Mucin-2-like isoform X2 n=1 Tax=Acanthaster planci TaxID=133434 RepID=A0A8B7XPI8_ACAPL|nr:mucin-2-like isoform X2 [Acanthaster planci]
MVRLEFILLLLVVAGADAISFRVEPGQKTVVIGRTVTLRCQVDDQSGISVYWQNVLTGQYLSRDRKIDPFNRLNDSIRGRYRIVGNSDGEYNLMIRRVSMTDGSYYACAYFTDVAYYSQVVRIKVLKPPDKGFPLCLLGPKLEMKIGDNVTLVCESRGGKPPATLTWVRGKQIVRSTFIPHATRTVIGYKHTLTEADRDVRFTCLARNEALPQPRSCYVIPLRSRIKVMLRPVVTWVTPGDSVIFNCISENVPNLEYQWTVNGNVITKSTAKYRLLRKGVKLKIINVTLRDELSVIICRVEQKQLGLGDRAVGQLWIRRTDSNLPELSSTTQQSIPQTPAVIPTVNTNRFWEQSSGEFSNSGLSFFETTTSTLMTTGEIFTTEPFIQLIGTTEPDNTQLVAVSELGTITEPVTTPPVTITEPDTAQQITTAKLITIQPVSTTELVTTGSVITTEVVATQPVTITEPVTAQEITTVKLITIQPGSTTELVTTQPVNTTEPVTTGSVTTTEAVTAQPVAITEPVTAQQITTTKLIPIQPVSTIEPVTTQPVTTTEPVGTLVATTLEPVTTTEPVATHPIITTKLVTTTRLFTTEIETTEAQTTSGNVLATIGSQPSLSTDVPNVIGANNALTSLNPVSGEPDNLIPVAFKPTRDEWDSVLYENNLPLARLGIGTHEQRGDVPQATSPSPPTTGQTAMGAKEPTHPITDRTTTRHTTLISDKPSQTTESNGKSKAGIAAGLSIMFIGLLFALIGMAFYFIKSRRS